MGIDGRISWMGPALLHDRKYELEHMVTADILWQGISGCLSASGDFLFPLGAVRKLCRMEQERIRSGLLSWLEKILLQKYQKNLREVPSIL